MQNRCLQINKNTDNTYYSFYDIDAYSSLIKNDSTLQNIGLEKTTCLDQIINLKNITLTFYPYCNDKTIEFSKNIKYFEEIILHYLSQILPSNVILNIVIGDKPIDNSSTILTIENGEVIESTLRVNGTVKNIVIPFNEVPLTKPHLSEIQNLS